MRNNLENLWLMIFLILMAWLLDYNYIDNVSVQMFWATLPLLVCDACNHYQIR